MCTNIDKYIWYTERAKLIYSTHWCKCDGLLLAITHAGHFITPSSISFVDIFQDWGFDDVYICRNVRSIYGLAIALLKRDDCALEYAVLLSASRLVLHDCSSHVLYWGFITFEALFRFLLRIEKLQIFLKISTISRWLFRFRFHCTYFSYSLSFVNNREWYIARATLSLIFKLLQWLFSYTGNYFYLPLSRELLIYTRIDVVISPTRLVNGPY